MKNRMAYVLIASLFVFSCNKKDDNQLTPPEVKQQAIVNTQWCNADHMTSSWDVVTRFTISGNDINQELISFVQNDAPLFYKNSKIYSRFESDSIEVITDVNQVHALKEFNQQRMLVEQSLSKHPGVNNAVFNPSTALVIKSHGLLSGPSETNLYPCSSYSTAVTGQGEQRSMIEFNLMLSQSISHRMSPGISLKFPIKETTTKLENLNGSQWCNWFEMEDGKLFLKTMTVGESSLFTNSYVQMDWADDKMALKSLADTAERPTEWKISNYETRLEAKMVDTIGSSFEAKGLYATATDASGTDLLLDLNAYNAESGSPNVYFKCSDDRLIQYNEFYKKYLPVILDAEKKHLTK